MAEKKISVIGSGWVGTAVGKGVADLGNEVIFYDVADKDLSNFTRNINYAIEHSDVSFVCVPTPTAPEGIDLSYVREASKNIGKALANKDDYHLVVVKSTVVPTTTEKIVIPILEEYSGKKARDGEIGICTNPEFLTEIESSWTEDKGYKKDFFTEDRIVIGEYDKKSGDVLEEVYEPLNKPIFRTDLKTAEMMKYVSNCMLATKISYWNGIYLICKELDLDSHVIADVVGLDPRIGKYGTVHGKAFGGKCLPKDLKAFIAFAEKYHKTKLLKAVDDINEEMKKKYGVRE
ncbi:MAG: UDP-glucose/GDP-mannose dehydrogenase family protein [Candidatus Atribacteria bacterium]|nr:UDP-glucose/GDP-mannose dehydrogenase family protein [Candidatus Atribacteria bacterium]